MYQPAFIYLYTLYKAFNAYLSLDTRGVFLDMPKAFDKVWHEGLIYKLKLMGVSDSLLKLLLLLYSLLKACMPQWSILAPLRFLIYINDLSENIESTVKIFADDTSLFSVVHNNNTSAKALNRDLQKISESSLNGKCHSILM